MTQTSNPILILAFFLVACKLKNIFYRKVKFLGNELSFYNWLWHV